MYLEKTVQCLYHLGWTWNIALYSGIMISHMGLVCSWFAICWANVHFEKQWQKVLAYYILYVQCTLYDLCKLCICRSVSHIGVVASWLAISLANVHLAKSWTSNLYHIFTTSCSVSVEVCHISMQSIVHICRSVSHIGVVASWLAICRANVHLAPPNHSKLTCPHPISLSFVFI